MKTTAPSLSRRAEAALVTLYFSLMTFFMTWPLLTRMGSAMIGEVGDNIYFVWMIGWVKRALFELHVNPFDIWFLNFPQGWNMAYTEITPAQLAIALPFSLLAGETFAYNAALLLSFILSGLTMYLWVRRLLGRIDAALLAGTIYAFLPYHMAHFLIGHLNLVGMQWFPLFFMAFWETLEARNRDWKAPTLAGIALGLIALTSQYYVYMTLIVSAFMGACYLLFLNRAQIKSGAFWLRMAVLGAAAAPLILLGIAPYLALSSQGGLPDRSLEFVRKLAIGNPTDFILPSTDHFLWGAWVGAQFNRELWVENTAYIGAVPIALGVLAWFKRRKLGQVRLLIFLLLGGLFAFVLALGIELHWMNEPLRIPRPAFLSGILHSPSYPALLPGYFLYKFLPFYSKLRVYMRFSIFVLLFFAAAAGLGSAWLFQRFIGRWRTLAAAGLLALVLLEFYPGPYKQFSKVSPRPVDVWLSQQPGSGALIQFPFAESEDQQQVFYTLTHRKPFVGGFFNAFPPEQYARIRPVMEHFPDDESVALLRELGVQYVLIDADQYPNLGEVQHECVRLGLVYVTEIEGEVVYEIIN